MLLLLAYSLYITNDCELLSVPSPLDLFFRAIQLSGVFLFIYASKHFNLFEFLGLKQAFCFLTKKPLKDTDIEGLNNKELITTGAYSIVRHPMYLSGILIFTFNPSISINSLTITVLADVYLVFGAYIESKRYMVKFGNDYIKYMQRVPMLIPNSFRPKRETET